MTVGMMAGQWCPHGLDPDQPGDQQLEEAGSLIFDTQALERELSILGAPRIRLEISSDKPNAMLAACLSEVFPDGRATRVSYGLLNLTHMNSHENPELLTEGKKYTIVLKLNEAGHCFGVGNRIRLALSTVYWPIAWPSPERSTLTLGENGMSLMLPIRPDRSSDQVLKPYEEPEAAEPLAKTVIKEPEYKWRFERDMASEIVTQHQWFDEGTTQYDLHNGWTVSSTHDEQMSVHPNDPLSAKLQIIWTERFERDDWNVSSKTKTVFTSTKTHFNVEAELEAFEGESKKLSKKWSKSFLRNCN